MARVLVAFLMMFLALSAIASAQTECPNIISQLTPCASYIQGQGGEGPPGPCCDGVKQIYNLGSQQKSDRVDICNCLKQELLQLKSVVPALISGLPEACGVSFQMPPLDPNYDCSTIG